MPLISVLRTFDDAETLEKASAQSAFEVLLVTKELWSGTVESVPIVGSIFCLPDPESPESYRVTKVVRLPEQAHEKDTIPSIFVHVEPLPKDKGT